jgi:hypothetical protein
MTSTARPSESIEFPLDEVDRGIVDLIPKMPKPAGSAAFHSLRHLNGAWRIREIDPEMALFRSITAEEEAATALFLSLKGRGYEGAERLKHRNHVQKQAVIPFFEAVYRQVDPHADKLPPAHLFVDRSTQPERLLLGFYVIDQATGEKDWGYPQPPFNLKVSKGTIGDGEWPEGFAEEMAALANESNAKSVLKFLEERANLRNQILYASADGVPVLEGDVVNALRTYQGNVLSILKVYLLIEPYAERQPFVQQALTAFLKLLSRVPEPSDDFAAT